MARVYLLYLFLVSICICMSNGNEKKQKETDDEFIATKDWQIVREGQAIPSGLHVRINLQTGLKEAKLMDEENQETENLTNELDARILDQPALIEMKQFKDAIKERKQFRSYETIKSELGDLVPKTDAEIITNLLATYRNITDTNTKHLLTILEDLEYLAHQYDNAIEFVSQNGFKDLILKNLNNTDSSVVISTLKLSGALTQHNAKVQIHAFEMGLVNVLSRLLYLKQEHEVQTATTHALSCILRRFPLAQKDFLVNGGLNIITELLENQDTKLHVKLCTLIDDLVNEYYEAVKNSEDEEKVRQYSEINLVKKLEELNWCVSLENVLLSVVIENRHDYDSIEKILKAMHNIGNCPESLRVILLNLERQFLELDRSENESDEYFKSLYELCINIESKFVKGGQQRDEL